MKGVFILPATNRSLGTSYYNKLRFLTKSGETWRNYIDLYLVKVQGQISEASIKVGIGLMLVVRMCLSMDSEFQRVRRFPEIRYTTRAARFGNIWDVERLELETTQNKSSGNGYV